MAPPADRPRRAGAALDRHLRHRPKSWWRATRRDSPLGRWSPTRVQINVRRVHACRGWAHMSCYVEEYPYDRAVRGCGAACCCRIEPAPAADGSLRVRQFTRKASRAIPRADAGRRRSPCPAATSSSSAKARSFAAARADASASNPTGARATLARLSRGDRRRAVLVSQAHA